VSLCGHFANIALKRQCESAEATQVYHLPRSSSLLSVLARYRVLMSTEDTAEAGGMSLVIIFMNQRQITIGMMMALDEK